MTLRTKVFLPILGVSAFLIGYLLLSWMPGHIEETEAEAEESSRQQLALVGESFVPYLLSRQLDAIYDVLDTLKRRNPAWIAIELTAPDGTVLYPLDPAPGAMVAARDEVVVRQVVSIHDVELGRLAARIDVHAKLDAARRRHGELVFGALLVVACYVSLLWFVLDRGVRLPVGLLAHASKRLAAGEFETPLHRAGIAEVDALVESFSTMRGALRGYQAELIAKSDSLKSLSEAVAQSPISIVIAGPAGLIEYANPRFYELTAQTPAETIGQPCEVLSGACLPEARRAEVRAAVEVGAGWRGELQRGRKDGKPFQASVFIAPVRDERGAVAHWLVMMEDVTHQRALEQQLTQAQKMEALGTLAGGIAHDFNNVLSPIIGYTELARTHAAEHPELAEDLAQVSEAAFRARDLVRQILTFSRKAEKRKVPLHVSAVAQEALKLLRSTIPSTIEIRQRFEHDGQVLADPTQIHQVIMNLCTNAFHAMEEAGGVLALAVEEVAVGPGSGHGGGLAPGRYVALSVSDTGVGMDKETLGRIFDPYFTTKEKGKGTGLGLAVVDGIVRDHDGRIAVYSEPGAGTTFKVYLPTTERAAAAGAVREAVGPVTGHERILVVDDEESIRSIVGTWLKQAGYTVAVYATGTEALENFKRAPAEWDLLVTDMTMPGLNGKELAKRAMELRPDFPVVLCCGYSSLINAEEAARMGIRAYLEKPVVMRELLVCIRDVLDGKASKVA